MDKYTKTINALKKEYKELQKNKKNIKGGMEGSVVDGVGVVGSTIETSPLATSDVNTKKKGNTQDPLQEQSPEVSPTKISKEVKKGNPSNSTVVRDTDEIVRLFIDENSKPTFDTDFRDIFDIDVEELTLEKKQNISKFIEHGEEIKSMLSNTIIDITDITILDIMKYLEEINESSDDSGLFINPYKENLELEKKNKYIKNFKKLIIKILEQQYFLKEKQDLEKYYESANTFFSTVPEKGSSENICNRQEMGPFMSLVILQ